jgi:galactofuranosylgalactofuranosylrhamnosyl-N-acetylglucosaminyl-diphospho-decaprenol beta-1,5/1,6-galactofuranosyltransferase
VRALLRESILLHLKLRQNWDELQEQYRAHLGDVTSQQAWVTTINEAAARDSAGK